MASVSNKVRKKTVSYTLPDSIYDKAVLAAQSGGMSLASWLRFGTMTYVNRWKAPAGNTLVSGFLCIQCQRPADKCSHPKMHKESDMWVEAEDE